MKVEQKGSLRPYVEGVIKMEKTSISIEVDEGGIHRVLIFADTAKEQAKAHLLLAQVTEELCWLDLALKHAQANEDFWG